MNMTEKNFKLKCPKEKIYKGYIELIRPFLPKITNQEADVLGELIKQYNLKHNIVNNSDRFKLIFESSNRRKMEESLNMTSASFRNIIHYLKKKGLITEDNELREIFLIEFENEFKLSFNFLFEPNE